MVSVEKLSEGLLRGRFLHCRPKEGSRIVQVQIHDVGDEVPVTNKILYCPLRLPASRCFATKKLCHYWRTPYIIGLGTDKKTENYQNTLDVNKET